MKEHGVVLNQLLLNPPFINSVVNPRRSLLSLTSDISFNKTKMPRRKKETCENNAKRLISRPGSGIKEKPVQRNAANARERARMRVLSRAFCRLKTSLPWVPPDTKLSKLDTLRLTTSYIAHLKGILQDDPYKPAEPLHPAMSLTWPFGFNRLGAGGSGGGGSEDDEEDDEGSNCSSWEEVRTRLVGRGDCVHLDGAPNEPGNNPVHSGHNPVYQHHHIPININPNTLLSNSYQENILSFS